MFFIPQSGLSQDIIYDRNSNLEGNINSPQNLPQDSLQSFFPPTQVPLEEYTTPIVTQKNNQPELNLFDLTATIVDEETDNQTEILTENSAEISNIKDDNDASQSISKEQLIDSDVFNNNMHLSGIIFLLRITHLTLISSSANYFLRKLLNQNLNPICRLMKVHYSQN